jgi:hypothetical protein
VLIRCLSNTQPVGIIGTPTIPVNRLGLIFKLQAIISWTLKKRNNEERQRERMFIIFCMLISLLERAYLLLYEGDMKEKQLRRWRSWEDCMGEWCNCADFPAALSALLPGGYPKFTDHLQKLAASDQVRSTKRKGTAC